MQLRENGFAMHLFRLDVPQGETTNLSGNLDIEDGPATWSPDGSQIALGRKPPRTPTGKQIWLMAPDGGNAVKVTADAAVHHGAVSWSATGTALVFQRYAIDIPAALPGVWTLDLSTGVTQEIAAEGLQPSWLP
jgi:Tol biopolymer transport system component